MIADLLAAYGVRLQASDVEGTQEARRRPPLDDLQIPSRAGPGSVLLGPRWTGGAGDVVEILEIVEHNHGICGGVA